MKKGILILILVFVLVSSLIILSEDVNARACECNRDEDCWGSYGGCADSRYRCISDEASGKKYCEEVCDSGCVPAVAGKWLNSGGCGNCGTKQRLCDGCKLTSERCINEINCDAQDSCVGTTYNNYYCASPSNCGVTSTPNSVNCCRTSGSCAGVTVCPGYECCNNNIQPASQTCPGDNICEAGENFPGDVGSCTPTNSCYSVICTNGCVQNLQCGSVGSCDGPEDVNWCNSCKASSESGNCFDNINNDCDSKTDCSDTDCGSDSQCSSFVPEVCDNGVDDDGDTIVDCSDSDCSSASNCQSCSGSCPASICNSRTEVCTNGLDDDCDGAVDVADSDCCSLTSVDIKAENCGSSGCSSSDEILVYSTYSASCPSTVYVQVDAENEDEECIIEFNRSVADIQGIEVTCTSSPCSKLWELPSSIPSKCKGEVIRAKAGGIYSSSDYSASNFLDGAASVTGRFRIRGTGDCALDCDNDGDCYEECETALNCAPDPDCEGGSGDTDGDGIPDFIDDCPNTPAGATVDANGCSEGDFGCSSLWDCTAAVWNECDEISNTKTRDVTKCIGPNSITHPECSAGVYTPVSVKECEAAKEFPFFGWMNMLISISLLIGYYVWRKKY